MARGLASALLAGPRLKVKRVVLFALIAGLAPSARAQVCGDTPVQIDADLTTNPTRSIEITDSAGTATTVALDANNNIILQDGSPLPSGSIRIKNIGTGVNNGGQAFDLLITIPSPTTTYNDVSVGYVASTGSFPLLVTGLGYTCLGAEIAPSTCADPSATLDVNTATCSVGATVVNGAHAYVRAHAAVCRL
jgi:hypothetical protein